ncbi:MAG: hypothetical protein ABIN67_15965 [Ferruginibacter sp.]
MSATLNITDILSRVKELDKDEQLTLLEKLVGLIRKNGPTKSHIKLSGISGIGSKIWSETSIDKYIDEERQW